MSIVEPRASGAVAARPSPALRADLRTRAMDVAERLALLGALGFSLYANIASHSALNVATLLNDLLVVAFVLVRRRASCVSPAPLDWALAFGASLGVLLMRPGGAPLIGPAVALGLAVPGWAVALAATVSLNRGFGLVPANRGVRTRGAYAVVRHPMYLGYLLNHTAYLLLNPTAANLAVYLGVWGCQAARILREERLLTDDPAYGAYRARVRFRLVPGLI